jgi:hypothetical protein
MVILFSKRILFLFGGEEYLKRIVAQGPFASNTMPENLRKLMKISIPANTATINHAPANVQDQIS